jgi:hypothetical protein
MAIGVMAAPLLRSNATTGSLPSARKSGAIAQWVSSIFGLLRTAVGIPAN